MEEKIRKIFKIEKISKNSKILKCKPSKAFAQQIALGKGIRILDRDWHSVLVGDRRRTVTLYVAWVNAVAVLKSLKVI